MERDTMDKEDLLKQTKLHLRGVVESSQKCLYLHEVENEYKSLTSQELPYRELGFSSPVDLYRSMSDVVYIVQTERGQVLLSVPSKQSAHLERMVREQNDSSKNSHRQHRPTRQRVADNAPHPPITIRHTIPYPYKFSHVPVLDFEPLAAFSPYCTVPTYPPTLRMPWSSQVIGGFYQPKRQQNFIVPKSVPVSVKNAIQYIVWNNPEGLTFNNLQKLYGISTGANLNPFTYGYSGWPEFIGALSDIVKLRNTGSYLIVLPIEHLPTLNNSFVNDQPRLTSSLTEKVVEDLPINKPLQEIKGERFDKANFDLHLNIMSSTNNTLDQHISSSAANKVDGESLADMTLCFENVTLTKRKEYYTALNSGNDKMKDIRSCDTGTCPETIHCDGFEGKNENSTHVLKNIFSHHRNGSSENRSSLVNEKHTGYQCGLSKINCNSIEVVRDESRVLYCESNEKQRSEGSILPLFKLSDKEDIPHARNGTEETDVNPVVLRKMLQVVCSTRSGINVNGFNDLYKELHGEEFCVDTSPDITLLPLILKLKAYFEVTSVNDQTIIVSATPYGSNWLKKSTAFFLHKSPKCDISALAAICCKKVPTLQLPSDITIDSYCRVYVCSIFHPGKFWIQLDRHLSKLQQLSEEMNNTYTNTKQFAIPTDLLQKFCTTESVTCAGFCKETANWKRVTVMDFRDNEEVDITFIDYGNAATVTLADLKFLREEFLNVPIFCYRARLTNSKGISNAMWTVLAKRKFMELCLNKTLAARFKSIEIPLSLELFEETGTTVVDIYKVMEKQPGLKFHVKANISPKEAVSNMKNIKVTEIKSDVGENVVKLVKECPLRSIAPSFSPLIYQDDVINSTKVNMKLLPKSYNKALKTTTMNSLVNCNVSENSTTPIETLAVKHDIIITDSKSAMQSKNRNSLESISVIQSSDNLYQILPLLLLGKQLHVVHFFGINYFQTFEISRLIWKADILQQMAEALKFDLKCVIITAEINFKMYEELHKTRQSISGSDITCEDIFLVSVKKVAEILPQVALLHEDVVKAVLRLVEMFS